MKRAEFKERYKIEDAMPLEPGSRSMHASSFSEAIEEFINNNFRGVAEVTTAVKTNESVMVCKDYMAFYFKTLLSYIHGRVFLNILIESEEKRLVMRIDADEPLPLTYEEMNDVIRAARNARMQVYLSDNGMMLTLDYSAAARHRVYALSMRDGKGALLSAFGEIFFCPAPLPKPTKRTRRQKKSTK